MTTPHAAHEGLRPLTEDPVKHMEFLQLVIGRMAANALAAKTWAVTVVSALFVVGIESSVPWPTYLFALLPTMLCWGVDAYFFRRERLFRRSYDSIRLGTHDFTNDPFSLDTTPFVKGVPGWLGTSLSLAVAPLYVALVAVVFLFSALVKSAPGGH